MMDYIKLDEEDYMVLVNQDILKYRCYIDVPGFIMDYIDLYDSSHIECLNIFNGDYAYYGEENTVLENIALVEFTDMLIAMLNYTIGECYIDRPSIKLYDDEVCEKLDSELQCCKNVGSNFVIEPNGSIRFIDLDLGDITTLSNYKYIYHYMNNMIVEIPVEELLNVERISLLYIMYGMYDNMYNSEYSDLNEFLNENIELFRKECAPVQEQFEIGRGKIYKYFDKDSSLSEVLGFLVLFDLMGVYCEKVEFSYGTNINYDMFVQDGIISINNTLEDMDYDNIVFSEYRVSFLYNFNGTRTTYLKETRDIYNKDETELIINI